MSAAAVGKRLPQLRWQAWRVLLHLELADDGFVEPGRPVVRGKTVDLHLG
jgi:hypothetical protein